MSAQRVTALLRVLSLSTQIAKLFDRGALEAQVHWKSSCTGILLKQVNLLMQDHPASMLKKHNIINERKIHVKESYMQVP